MKTYNLLKSWAKSPFLNRAELLIVGSCVKDIYPEIFNKLAQGKTVLEHCPEIEQPVFGKLASMLTSTKPKSIIVLTVDCSPHCYTLHAAVNEAYYLGKISEKKIPKEHYVVLDGKVNKISPEAIRLSRYLTLSEEAIRENPKLVNELKRYSLEQKQSIK